MELKSYVIDQMQFPVDPRGSGVGENSRALLKMDGSGIVARPRRADVSVVTVVCHAGPVLWDCIDSVLSQSETVELVIVINGADPDTRSRLGELARNDRRIRLVDPGRNIGFAPGCNLGAASARGDYLAFVNPDCHLAPGTLAAILDVFARNAGAWLVGGRLQYPDGREQRGGRREFLTPWRAFVEATRLDRLLPNHPHFRRFNLLDQSPMPGAAQVPVVSGAFMMIQRSRYEHLGGMDNDFFLHFDDVDLCLRVHLQGGEIWYAGNVPITHHRSTSEVPRLFVEWHKARSGCRYFRKHFRRTYPAWSLSAVSAVLWARFALVALKILSYELGIVSPPQHEAPTEGGARRTAAGARDGWKSQDFPRLG